MSWGEKKKHDDEKPVTLMSRFFRACLLTLAGVFALWLAMQLLAQFWGWLLLAGALGGLAWATVWCIRWRRDRRW